MSDSNAENANQRMVDRLIAQGALWSPKLIAAFRQTPRHRFLDRVFVLQQQSEGWRQIDTREPTAEEVELLYTDRALITRLSTDEAGRQVPISSSSQPSLIAEMLEDLHLERSQRVLEIGTGTGYNAALLAHVVGEGLVHTVDVDKVVLAEACEHFARFAERKIRLHHGDGRNGWQEAAPFDRLIVTAATPDLEPAWLAQLPDGGMLLAPVLLAPGMAFIACGIVRQGVFEGALTRGAYFMPLRTEEERPLEDSEPNYPAAPLHTLPAPWAGWFDRNRPRLSPSHFVQALAFYGWLRGLSVVHNSGSVAYASFGVRSDAGLCWFGAEDWQVNGPEGQEVAEWLWNDWLQAGGPWPTEFMLTASAIREIEIEGPECYLRRGPHCRQVWRLKEIRERQGWR